MSAEGSYHLVLRCDSKFGPQECPIWNQFDKPTRAEAKEEARRFGWMLARKNRCFCPDHAEERRASWR